MTVGRDLLRERPGTPVLRLVRHCDGSLVWLEATMQRVDGRGIAPVSWLVTAVDVTARVVAEQALAAREDRLGAAFDESPVAMALTGVDGRHLKVNAALCALLGRTQEQLLAVRWQDLTHPDDTAGDTAELQATLDGRQDGYRLDKRFLLPNGAPVNVVLQVRIVRGDQGEPWYAVAHVQARPVPAVSR